MRDIKGRLAAGTLWSAGGRVAGGLLLVGSTLVLARLLVPADFGLVALGTTTLAILQALTNLPVASALVQHRNPTEAHYHTAWTLGAARGLVLAAAFCLLAWPVAELFNEPRLRDVMYVLSLNVILVGLLNPYLIKKQKELVFWQMFVVAVTNALVMAVTAIAIAIVYESYWALVIGAVAGQTASTLVSYIMFPYRPRPSLKHIREIWSFSVWLTLEQSIATLNYRFDHLLIGGFLGRAALGHYTVGSNLAVVATREIVQPLTQTLFPGFSLVSQDPDRLRRGYQRAQTTITAAVLPIALGFALIAEPFVYLTMGAKWAPAIFVIQIVGPVYAFATLGTLVAPLAMSTGDTRYLFVRSTQIFLIRVPLIAIGMYLAGLAGVLYARALAGAIGVAINLSMIRSLLGIPVLAQLRANYRCFAAAAAMAGAVLLVQNGLPGRSAVDLALSIGASVAVGALVYIATNWLLWVIARRPAGPETEIADFAGKLLRRRNRTAPSAGPDSSPD